MADYQPPRRQERIDLDTLRETLAYMHADTRSDTQLAGIANALEQAIAEIDKVCPASNNDNETRYAPRFLPAKLISLR